jgi:flavin-dependent thymidylate synthase
MHFIKSNAEEIVEVNPYKKVERIGRICYKSEDKITSDSYRKFVSNLINRKHYAMLEHARLFFEITLTDREEESSLDKCRRIIADFSNIPAIYTNWVRYEDTIKLGISISMSHAYNPKWRNAEFCSENAASLLDAFRFLVEHEYFFKDEDEFDISDIWDAYELNLSDIEYVSEEKLNDVYHSISYDTGNMEFVSVKFDCDRGVSHELVRHRVAVAQSSTRYCNYSKEKFGNGDIAFVYPHDYDNWDNSVKALFEKNLQECEDTYNYMTSNGMSPQQARAVLPNALATEVVLTMNLYQWEHFIDLRYRGTTGAPHPDMKDVALIAYHDILHSYLEKISDIYLEHLND